MTYSAIKDDWNFDRKPALRAARHVWWLFQATIAGLFVVIAIYIYIQKD